MLSSFHKTASECWRRTPETQKGSPFSSKGGRTNYRRRKSYGWRSTLRRELWRRRSFQQKKFLTETEVSGRGNPLTDRSVGSFGISEGNITRRKNNTNNNPQNMCLTATASRQVTQRLKSTTSEQGLDREATSCIIGPQGKDQARMPWGPSEGAHLR